MSTQQNLKTPIRKAKSIQANSIQQLTDKSGEDQIYLNTILSSFSITALPLKNFNRKLKKGLRNKKINEQQNTQKNKCVELLKEQGTNKQHLPSIGHQIKSGINNSLQISRGVNNDFPSRKKSCSDKKSMYQIPILNQEEQSEQDRSPSYIERLLTSQRILKSKKKEQSMQQESSRRFSKCTLNKRIFNKVCKKESPQKKHIQQLSPSKKQRQSQIAKFFNYKNAWHKNEPILSPIKPAQRPIESNKPVVNVKAIMKSSSHSRQQFGPWKDESQHINMDL